MEFEPGDRSNIEDERGRSGGGFGGSGFGAMHLGVGGFLVVLFLSWLSGTNLFSVLGTGDDSSAPSQTTGTTGAVRGSPAEERNVDLVDQVANDVQDTWTKLLGSRYERTHVVLFREGIQSGCGSAQSAMGPFYCPEDHKVYLDLEFFKELSQRFGAPGDFAQAYVIAHEFGHHVQNLLGLDRRAAGSRRTGADSASVALELQADCFAGVWGHAASQNGRVQAGHVKLDPGDADQALHAASAIGDDRLQKMSTGRVMPDRFTHGSSAQRVESFGRGMESGDPRVCGAPASAMTH